MSKRLTFVIAAAAGLSTAANVSAQQQAQPPRGPQTPTGRAPGQSQQPVRIPYSATSNEAATAFQRNGGSLARASLASQPEMAPNGKSGRQVSYTDVPEQEPKIIRKHDLISIIVREESSFSSAGTTETKRSSDIDARIDELFKIKLANLQIKPGAIGTTPPSIKASASRNMKGEGTTERTDSMTARMQAEVIDVKPNGTLVLQARKTIKTDEEEQAFTLIGTARVEDVVADNTVLSTQLYDLRLEKTTKGVVRSANNKGLVGKVLDFINPF